MDRSWFTTFSMYCSYAGNTLMLKKGNHQVCRGPLHLLPQGAEGLSEHMFITGMTGPGGRKTFFAGAAPSGCGKTTTAMVGTDYVGDDLAQLWIDKEGILRAVNPEIGIFGIVEDLNKEGDPYLYRCMREPVTEVIWSNVLVDEHGVPHWAGSGEPLPSKGNNFQGEWWPEKKNKNGKPVPCLQPERTHHPDKRRHRELQQKSGLGPGRRCQSRLSRTAEGTATQCRPSGSRRTRTTES